MINALSAPPFPLAGEAASLGAAFIWASSLTLFTYFGRGIAASTLNLFKNGVATLCLFASVLIFQPDIPLDANLFWSLGLSGVIGLTIGDSALFGALKRLGAQLTSVSQCIVPPITALMAIVWMGETLSCWETIGMLIATSAVALTLYDSRKDGSLLTNLPKKTLLSGLLMCLTAAISQAVAIILIRNHMQQVNVFVGTLYRVLPSLVTLLIFALVRRNMRHLSTMMQDRRRVFWLGTASFFGTFVGLLLMSVGAKYSKAGITTALMATYPVWIIPLSLIVLKEKVTIKKTLFALLAVTGISIMVLGA